MSLGVFIQVRLASTRLPAKALLPLPGGMIIQHVMRSMALVPADVRALLTEAGSAEALAPLAREEGFLVFIGPREDVLARYCMASREYHVDKVIRATGDNPLTSATLARSILSLHIESGADLSHYVGVPWGSGVEVIRSESLFVAEREAMDPAEREHVTPFLYRHPDRFRINEQEAPYGFRLPEARVTVDTEEDYVRVRRIFEDLYTGEPIEASRLVPWFLSAANARGDQK
jgi:spore coat polysaccharide biosynthesis protein SpsF